MSIVAKDNMMLLLPWGKRFEISVGRTLYERISLRDGLIKASVWNYVANFIEPPDTSNRDLGPNVWRYQAGGTEYDSPEAAMEACDKKLESRGYILIPEGQIERYREKLMLLI